MKSVALSALLLTVRSATLRGPLASLQTGDAGDIDVDQFLQADKQQDKREVEDALSKQLWQATATGNEGLEEEQFRLQRTEAQQADEILHPEKVHKRIELVATTTTTTTGNIYMKDLGLAFLQTDDVGDIDVDQFLQADKQQDMRETADALKKKSLQAATTGNEGLEEEKFRLQRTEAQQADEILHPEKVHKRIELVATTTTTTTGNIYMKDLGLAFLQTDNSGDIDVDQFLQADKQQDKSEVEDALSKQAVQAAATGNEDVEGELFRLQRTEAQQADEILHPEKVHKRIELVETTTTTTTGNIYMKDLGLA